MLKDGHKKEEGQGHASLLILIELVLEESDGHLDPGLAPTAAYDLYQHVVECALAEREFDRPDAAVMLESCVDVLLLSNKVVKEPQQANY